MSNFPTLDGLNNISGDSADLNDIICQTFIATTSAQAPTMTTGNISNNIATTAFVDDAITNAPYVTTNTTQTLTTGTKYFTNLPECATLATTGNQFTNKTYVDNAVSGAGGSYVTIAGTQTLTTGVKTFTNLPESSATPTTANQLVPKTYVDSNFVALTGTQTITGNKTFFPTSGSTIIRGTQADIFADTTFLTGNTTTISGVNCNITSTTNYIAGTTTSITTPTTNLSGTTTTISGTNCNITSPATNLSGTTTTISGTNCNITSPATNLSGTITTLSSPTINVTGTALNISSPTTTISSTNTNFTGTNTSLTGTIATATTQSSSDNSTKVATTEFVNSYATANYMTLTSNQNVSGIKTYSTKQVFNAGTACDTYDATGVTDMTISSNAIKSILTIKDNIVCDEIGSRIQYEGGNVQLNTGFFIESDVTQTPSVNFPLNQSTAYVNTVFNTADATKKITSGLQFWVGNSQTTNFEISHSITNISLSTIATLVESKIYFTFIDENTGITRYVSPINLATTTPFLISGASTVVRPNVTFSLTSIDLPEANYHVYAYSEITGKANNSLSVNWNLSYTATSPYVTVKNYNTPITDVILTNRIVKNCMRNYVAGVYHVNVIAGQQNIVTPIFYSLTYYVNIFSQASTSGALTTPAITGGTVAGNWGALSINNADNVYIVYPNYSLIVYNTQGWAGTIYLNFKNTTNNPVVVAPSTISAGSSCRVYFDEVELVAF